MKLLLQHRCPSSASEIKTILVVDPPTVVPHLFHLGRQRRVRSTGHLDEVRGVRKLSHQVLNRNSNCCSKDRHTRRQSSCKTGLDKVPLGHCWILRSDIDLSIKGNWTCILGSRGMNLLQNVHLIIANWFLTALGTTYGFQTSCHHGFLFSWLRLSHSPPKISKSIPHGPKVQAEPLATCFLRFFSSTSSSSPLDGTD